MCVDVSLTHLSDLETHFCLLGCLVQTQFEGWLLPCLSVSYFVLFECCVFDICFFLKKTQKANVSEREGRLGRATRSKGRENVVGMHCQRK